MSTSEETWAARLHDAVNDHPGALAFDVPSYVEAGRKRLRRNRAVGLVATVAAVAAAASLTAVIASGSRGGSPQPVDPVPTFPGAPNGWVALDSPRDGGGIYLVRPGEQPRPLEVAGSDAADDACPAWSPDGTRLLFGRLRGAAGSVAELVVVPVDQNGAAGNPTVIALDGFGALDGFDPHPCGTWASDGRWVALRGPSDVWVVDTQIGTIRRLPDLRPIDMEWRPGTDELTIAGDMGASRSSESVQTPVTVYSVSTGELRQLGSVTAGDLAWSPDGSTLAYETGLGSQAGLWLVDADGTNERLLHVHLPTALHGVGPVWSPIGDRIAYLQNFIGSLEGSEVVLVSVDDGSTTVIPPPEAGGPEGSRWFPFTVTWSPDGATLLYVAWNSELEPQDGVLAVPADHPRDAAVIADGFDTVGSYQDHQWVPLQMWGRQPG